MLRIGGESIPLVDCDVHETYRTAMDLLPYLSEPWRSYFTECLFRGPQGGPYANTAHGGRRPDTLPAGAAATDYRAGGELELCRKQLLDEYGVDYGILTSFFYYIAAMPQADFATALATAYNNWLLDHWLGKDKRIKGSVQVALQDPQGAAREIDRVGPHPDIVQLVVGAPAERGYGHPMYDPVWEACARNDLVVGIHVNMPSGIFLPPTPLGWPRYYMEWHASNSLQMQSHLLNLVCEGFFEKFPTLKVVFIEAGFSWVPHITWQLDQNWRSLRSEVPWVKRKPSEYIRERCYFTTQPMEEPDNVQHLLNMIEMVDGERTLLFATDYPHWDFDSPLYALPRQLDLKTRKRIFAENALELYGLPYPTTETVTAGSAPIDGVGTRA
ncbi:MAG: amidohydrolase [Chloroflexi bacterium]|nr:amidohydrolase [Chloroflexota bacterium]